VAFLSPIFLLGAAAAALPILVHLVRRTRARRVQFASLMFLRRIEQKTIRKRRLRNLALLAVRCLALLLLALAFARPYFVSSSQVEAKTAEPASVVLIDGSYSMRYPEVFDRARQQARDIITAAAPGEQVAIVLFSQSYDVVMPLKSDRAGALAVIDRLEPSLGATDYAQAIQAADALLKDAKGGERRVYLISDFQESGWGPAAPAARLGRDTKLFPIDVSDAQPANLAVGEIKSEPVVYSQKYAGKLLARVSNFGADPIDAAVEFKLNDLTVERRQVKLDGGASEAVEFSGFNVPEGLNRATVEVAADKFTLDNKAFFTIRREKQTRVLVIETASRGRSESFFIQQAMAAAENNQYEPSVKTAGTTNPAELDQYRLIVLNDVAGVSEALSAALKSYVERGGRLIMAAGKHSEAEGFNRAFESISPARIGDAVHNRGGYALMSQVEAEHPIFSVFARSGRLTSTRVYGYHRATPAEGASVIASLDDGTPLVTERAVGGGKVLLITTTLDTAWNDLPLTPMFLPFIHQVFHYLGGRESAAGYTVGQVFTAPADPDGSVPAIESPGGGRVEDARKGPNGELAVSASDVGFYRLRYRDRSEHVGVNLDARESNLSKMDVEKFVASISPEAGEAAAQPAPSERLGPEEMEARQRLWLWLLVVALLLFVAEAVLARRIRIARLVQ
jgi:hypothetical protein